MKSLPKRSYAGAALFLLCGFGWCGAVPLRAAEVASETVVVSTLDVRSDASRVTCVQLQSTARLDYNVSKPEPRLVSIDLYGADTSALQPEYRAEQGLVASVAVKAGLVGEATARLDITLREDCHVRSYLRNDAKTLVIEFEPLSPAAAGRQRRVRHRSHRQLVIQMLAQRRPLPRSRLFSAKLVRHGRPRLRVPGR